ncbi:Leucine-rich repeat-containing protein 34 [Lobosporangium transversale]|uniref:RNI-like protein n=1 Tax=Lobosporangium transversale TaxID=64571 RepID=A0A1Y2GBL8_9FUNG|nr:hypothetical protein BCR41DRAFT_363607 [Lobosporangium transversale]KAF9916446.1 Leucine-rich repeat-containing protein 34 [Lobosporangium transversale]ORZ00034.1 hypothetical protein BCR41DRAFT_363607 [Lobosporangium transversale]|eukprot:XP_021876075.1 hypothetical protein BCR41DRAFT_363607 [Lobosporangium transversale]
MAWGGGNTNSVESWVKRLRDNDATFTSLHILSFRRVTSSELGQIFEALTHNAILKEFYASGHSFDETAAKILATALEHNTTLERLNIGSDHLGNNEAVVKLLSEGLSKNKGLLRLDLENKGFGGHHETSVQYLAQALEKNITLQELILARNKLTDQDVQVLCQTITQGNNRTLQKLDLCLNSFTEAGARSIATLLASQNQADAGGLKEIDLSDNEITEEGGRAIGQALESNKALQRLRMSSCMDPPLPVEEGVEDKIPFDDDIQTLNRPLTSEQEREIRMDGDTVLETIASALKSNSTLQELWMDYCNVSSIGAGYLADALRHNHSLITVRMRNNRIGNRGARALGAALTPTCSTSTDAQLGGDEGQSIEPTQASLSSSEGVAVTATKSYNATLRNLELGSNMVGVLGWHGLVGARSLESLGLYENQINVLHKALEEQQQINPPSSPSSVPSTTMSPTNAPPSSSSLSANIPNGASFNSQQALEKLIHLDVGCNGISREDYTQLGVCLIKGMLPSLIRLEIAGNGDRSREAPQHSSPGRNHDDDEGEDNQEDPDDEQDAWQRVTSRIEEARPNLVIHWKGAGAMQQG